MTRILHIVPQVPPAVCGIGDYAWLLAQALRDEHDIHSSLLSAGTNWTKPEGVAEFPLYRLPELTTQALVNFVIARPGEFDALVLHMSSYGYQKRGVPMWLASGWRQLSQMTSRPRLITMFHELFASGPASSSAFWLKPLQQHVLRIIAQSSDSLRTNREAYAEWLRQLSKLKSAKVTAMPVFSNLGEPKLLLSWLEREPAMALFASGSHSGQSPDCMVQKAMNVCRRLGLKRLHLIGGNEITVKRDSILEVVRHGFMSASSVSRLLLSCRMAYTAYHSEYLAKSGIVAAFAAHGLVLITQGKASILPDGLEDKKNVFHEEFLCKNLPAQAELERTGGALRQWYETHSIVATAEDYSREIQRKE